VQGSEPEADIYVAPPRHEPNGSRRFSDVGMPFPIPSADLAAPPPRSTTLAPPDVPPTPFVGTSLRPPEGQPGFPESSFGPDAGP
jgi:hypothetical protein